MGAQPLPARRHDLVPASRILTLAGDITDHADGDPGAWQWRIDPRAPTPPVISIDVGADAAIAVLSDSVAAVRSFRFPSLDTRSMEALEAAMVWTRGFKLAGALVVVEDVFLARGPRANPSTAASLSRRVGAIVARLAPVAPVVRVLAVQWQTDVIGKATRETGKRRSVDVARARFPGLGVASDHESDALLIALWARGGRGARTTRSA